MEMEGSLVHIDVCQFTFALGIEHNKYNSSSLIFADKKEKSRIEAKLPESVL